MSKKETKVQVVQVETTGIVNAMILNSKLAFKVAKLQQIIERDTEFEESDDAPDYKWLTLSSKSLDTLNDILNILEKAFEDE